MRSRLGIALATMAVTGTLAAGTAAYAASDSSTTTTTPPASTTKAPPSKSQGKPPAGASHSGHNCPGM